MSVVLARPFRRALIAALVIVALFAAFEVYAWSTRRGGTHPSRGGSAFAVVPTPSATARDTAAAATPTPAASTRPTGSASPSSRPVTGTTAQQVQAADPTEAPQVRSSAAAQPPVTPRVGVYKLAVDGTEKVDFGPVSFCSRTLATATTLVVSPAQGEPSGSFDFDIRYYPGSAGQHDERHIYRYTDDRVLLGYENATVTCGGVQQASEVSYSPPQVRAELPLRVGASWDSTGGDAQRTEEAHSSVLRTETVQVGSAAVKTFVIETKVRITGSETGSRVQRWWYAPSLALPVKWFEHIDGSRSGATYSEDATVTVVATP